MEYGDFHAQKYKYIYLKQPLKESIAEKNAVLQLASDRYQQSADYGIFEFVTQSSYKIAGLYEQFAERLRRAPRPQGLSREQVLLYLEIIEDQAVPFDELALELHEANVTRAWDGQFDEWIDMSFAAMRKLNPERFDKQEKSVSYGDGIF